MKKSIFQKYFIDNNELDYGLSINNSEFENMFYFCIDFYYLDIETEEKSSVCKISGVILSPYDEQDILYMADAESGDILYVVESFISHCSQLMNMGSIIVIDNVSTHLETLSFEEKIIIYKNCISKFSDIAIYIGCNFILAMTKSLELRTSREERIQIIDMLMKIGFVPIHQDNIDFVMLKNVDCIV